MFELVLVFVVPLFLYCCYLFAKDIKSSYSMHSFKKSRLKSGNKSKVWKPVPLQELKAMDVEIIPTLVTNTAETNSTYNVPTVQEEQALTVDKPVIKLYKEFSSDNSGNSAAAEEDLSDKNLLLSIAKEMSIYDDKVRALLDSYQNKMEKYFAQLSEVVLVSDDKQTFVYPLERATGTTMFSYVVTESGVSEKNIELSELINYKILTDAEATDLEIILREYASIKENIQAYITRIKNDNILPLPRVGSLSGSRKSYPLPLAVH